MHESELSIGDYAAIGDCRTLALVSRLGSIDWLCIPDFSSPSLFAALLDQDHGGCFALAPRAMVTSVQAYLPRTNVLLTRMECRTGVLELTDFMTVPESADSTEGVQAVVRIAACVAGTIELDVLFEPRPDYARLPPRLHARGDHDWICSPMGGSLDLRTSFGLESNEPSLRGMVAMREGDTHAAVLTTPANQEPGQDSVLALAQRQLALTVGWWRSWCDSCSYQGDYADAVLRSALTLKLLTHRPTGAVVAAGTTSLPESETGERNWDYRFCWLRDSSLVFDAFTELGYSRESAAFLKWLLHATHRTRPRLQVVYDVYGGHELSEQVLPSLRGYHGIGPVRIGNAASSQVQNDVYGEVMLTVFDYVRHGGVLDGTEKELVAGFAQMVCDVWREPDNGIWEIRTHRRHNTQSKLMCWAALDRALRISDKQQLPIDAGMLARERDEIRSDIEAHAWSARLESYVGYYGSDAPDASLLLIPRLGYIDAHDPRMLGTRQRIVNELSVDGGLLYRFPPGQSYDGVQGSEHLFAICSFWLVDCLARQDRIDEACSLYERLLALRNPAGLFAEEIGVTSGRPIGNFPQAFSHVGSITAALSLHSAKRKHGRNG